MREPVVTSCDLPAIRPPVVPLLDRLKQAALGGVVRLLHSACGTRYTINVLGKKLVVFRGVYSPKFYNLVSFPTCHFLAANLLVLPGDRVLDLGTGTGIQALFAARTAATVVATDINPRALECARENAALHGHPNVEFRQGDLFDPVRGERFDLIIWTPPTWFGTPRKDIDHSWYCGGDGAVIRRFAKEAGGHLTERGRIQYVINYNNAFINEHLKRAGFTVDLYRFEKRRFRNSNYTYLAYKS